MSFGDTDTGELPVEVGSTYSYHKGQCATYNPETGSKHGHCVVYRSFSDPQGGLSNTRNALTGYRKGLLDVSQSALSMKRHGNCASYNGLLTGIRSGFMGVQAPLHGGTRRGGTCNVYWEFGGVNHLGNISVGIIGRVENLFIGTRRGQNRIANDSIAGYVAYIGAGGNLPELNGPEAAYSPTLPFNIPFPLPFPGQPYFAGGAAYTSSHHDLITHSAGGSGGIRYYEPVSFSNTQEVYVVVRKRDKYGLVSQNQRSTKFILTPEGILLAEVSPLRGFRTILKSGGQGFAQATYPGWNVDKHPADKWAIWTRLNDIPDTSQAPDKFLKAGPTLYSSIGPPLNGGNYFVSVALYRSLDASWSDVLTLPLNVPMPPECPTPLPNGYQLDCDCESETFEINRVVYTRYNDILVYASTGDGLAFHK